MAAQITAHETKVIVSSHEEKQLTNKKLYISFTKHSYKKNRSNNKALSHFFSLAKMLLVLNTDFVNKCGLYIKCNNFVVYQNTKSKTIKLNFNSTGAFKT